MILDAQSGEILALANWPTYNPNARNRVARESMRNRALTDVFEPGSTMKPFTIAAALESGRIRPDTVIQTAPGRSRIGLEHDPRRASERRADGRAGDPEIVERRRREDRADAAARDVWRTLSDAGFGAAPRTGFPGRGRRPAAPGEDLEADRAGDDGLRPRPLGEPGAAGARLHGVRERRRAEAGDAAQGQRRRWRAGRCCRPRDRARGAPDARARGAVRAARRRRRRFPGYRVAGKTGTAHKLEGRGYTNKYVASFVGFAPASARGSSSR